MDSRAVLEVLGLAGNLQTAQLMRHILDRNVQAALLLLNELYAGGKDVGAVLGELSTLTRDLLLRKTAPEGGAALLSGGFDSATLDQLGKDVPSNRFLYLPPPCKRPRLIFITAPTAAPMRSLSSAAV